MNSKYKALLLIALILASLFFIKQKEETPDTPETIDYLDKVAEGADPATYVKLSYSDERACIDNYPFYSKDKYRVYWKGVEIVDSDTDSFELLNDCYAKDKNGYYYWGYPVTSISEDRFQKLGGPYYVDDKYVYYNGEYSPAYFLLPEADKATFQVLSPQIGKDKEHVYFQSSIYSDYLDIDVPTFRKINDKKYQDKNSTYEISAATTGTEYLYKVE